MASFKNGFATCRRVLLICLTFPPPNKMRRARCQVIWLRWLAARTGQRRSPFDAPIQTQMARTPRQRYAFLVSPAIVLPPPLDANAAPVPVSNLRLLINTSTPFSASRTLAQRKNRAYMSYNLVFCAVLSAMWVCLMRASILRYSRFLLLSFSLSWLALYGGLPMMTLIFCCSAA